MDMKKVAEDINGVGELADELLTPFAKIHGQLAASQVMSMVMLCNNHVHTTKLLRHMASDPGQVPLIVAIDAANECATVGVLNTFLHGKDDAYCEAFKNVVSMILTKIDKIRI